MNRFLRIAFLFLALWGTTEAFGASSYIPQRAEKHRATLIREARFVFGMDAPIAALGAQIHQESLWRENAKSAFASGLTQFTPATVDTMENLSPSLANGDALNPTWAIRAQSFYMNKLLRQFTAKTECDDWGFALSGYNGGPGWVIKNKTQAKKEGKDPFVYWNSVELVKDGRKPEYLKENRDYPVKILLIHQPYYFTSGLYGTKQVCSEIIKSRRPTK